MVNVECSILSHSMLGSDSSLIPRKPLPVFQFLERLIIPSHSLEFHYHGATVEIIIHYGLWISGYWNIQSNGVKSALELWFCRLQKKKLWAKQGQTKSGQTTFFTTIFFQNFFSKSFKHFMQWIIWTRKNLWSGAWKMCL